MRRAIRAKDISVHNALGHSIPKRAWFGIYDHIAMSGHSRALVVMRTSILKISRHTRGTVRSLLNHLASRT